MRCSLQVVLVPVLRSLEPSAMPSVLRSSVGPSLSLSSFFLYPCRVQQRCSRAGLLVFKKWHGLDERNRARAGREGEKEELGRVARKRTCGLASVLSRFEIDSPFPSLSPVCLPGQFPASFSFRHGLLLVLVALPCRCRAIRDSPFSFFAFRYQYVLVVLLILSPIETGWRLGSWAGLHKTQ